jgi:hypothetical protein
MNGGEEETEFTTLSIWVALVLGGIMRTRI